MKNPLRPILGARASKVAPSHLARLLAGAAVFGTAHAITWLGNSSNAWNTAANWSPAAVPNGQTATINSTPANVARISVNPTATPTDITIGSGATGNGRLDHVGGTAQTGATNHLYVGTTGGTGRYHLADVDAPGTGIALSGKGTGSMNARSRLYVGGSLSGLSAASNGIIYLNTTGTLAVASWIEVGTAGATGVINLESGTVTGGDWVEFGNGASGNGTLNMTGGTFTKTGSNQFVIANNGSTGTATLSGGSITVNNEIWVGNGAGSNGTVSLGGTAAISGGNSVSIGRITGSGTVTMTNGTWTKAGSGNFIIGASGPGSMTQSGGIVDVQTGTTIIGNAAGATTAALTLTDSAEFRTPVFSVGVESPDAKLHLNGGTAKTGQFVGGNGVEVVNFNGTQIIATAVVPELAPQFIDSFDTADIQAGGLKIDTNGFNLGVPQFLTGTGGVTKSGAGTLTLYDANTNSGANTVLGGKLMVSSGASGIGNFTIANGAGMGVIQEFGSGALSVVHATFGTGGATSLDIDLGNFSGNTTVAPLHVSGTLTLNGTVTLNVADSLAAVGPIPLVSYASPKAGGGSFVLGTLPPGVSGTLSDNGTGLVTLTVQSVSLPVWDGTHDGVWDTTTANWIDQLSGQPIAYADPLPVLFNDDATGITDLTLDLTVAPYSLVFSNQADPYSLSGSGKITGSAGLTKQGGGALTLSTLNDFTGPVVLNGGVVTVNSIANGGSPSALGASPPAAANLVLNGSSLAYTGPHATSDRGVTVAAPETVISTVNDLAFSGPFAIAATATLRKSGPGNLTLANPGANVFGTAGQGLRVIEGTLTLSGSGTQTNTAAGELWVADTPDVPASLVLNDTTLTLASWLAIGRGNGDAGVCHLTATNSTLTTVNFSTGYNNGLAANGSEAFVTLNNTTWTNNGLTYLAESSGSAATMTLNGTSAYNINNNLLIGRLGTASGTLVLNGSSSITKTGGYTAIGNEGTGVLTMSGSSSFTAPSGDFNIGDVGTSNGTLNLSGTATVTSSPTFIGKNVNTRGTVNQSGGTFTSNNAITIGRSAGSTGIVNVSAGNFTAATTITVAEAGTGTLTLSGTGNVTANGGGITVCLNSTAVGTIHLNGGTLTTKRLVKGSTGNATLNFNGGVLRADTGANASFLNGFDTAALLAGGAVINTNGNNVTASQVLSGIGGFTKTGAGTLTLSGANTYSGPTVVNGGTLSVSGAWFADTSAITIAGGVLNLPHGVTDVVASLTIGTTTLGVGTYDAVTHPSAITGTGKIQVSGVVASPYDTWATSFGLNPLTDGAPAFDKDKDGEPNSIEFALGGSPISGRSRAKTFAIIADGSVDGDALKEQLITIAVRSGTPAFSGNPSPAATKDGYTYTLQGSTSLDSFPVTVTPVATVAPPAPDATPPAGYEYRTFSLGNTNGTPGKGFLRVKVTP